MVGRLSLTLQRLVLRTGTGPLRPVWSQVYRSLTGLAARYFARGTPDAAIFVGGGLGTDDVAPGLSDIDLLIVLPSGDGTAARRLADRYDRLPGPVRRVLDQPVVLTQHEARAATAGCTLTWGLADADPRVQDAIYGWDPVRSDLPRLLERPEPAGAADRWRYVRGPRLPLSAPRRAQHELVLAAWLEIVFWWRLTFMAALGRYGVRGRHLCAKLIAEPARVLLLAEHGEAYATRREALDRALVLYPEEEETLRIGRELLSTAADVAPFPLEDTVRRFADLSQRVACLVDQHGTAAGTTDARLRGDTSHRPLCDWRALVFEPTLDERLEVTPWDPADVDALGRVAGAEVSPTHHALQTGTLLVLPGPTFPGTRMRAVASRATDPVTFALLAGAPEATFPNHPGLGLTDVSRRAVAERRAAIARPGHAPSLGELLLAARAATIRASVEEGDPVIPLTPSAIADELVDRHPSRRDLVEQAHGELRSGGTEGTRASLQAFVRTLLEQA